MFTFGTRSLSKLQDVHPFMADTAKHAIVLSEVDFGISWGRRTFEQQQEMVRRGASKTMNSKHRGQPKHGLSVAIDVFAWVDGQVDWSEEHYYKIANAFALASRKTAPIRWGGCWEVLYPSLIVTPRAQVKKYVAAKRAKGQRPFLDLGHFELQNVPDSFIS